jgi:integrase
MGKKNQEKKMKRNFISKKTGLFKRKSIWTIGKMIHGQRYYLSTGETDERLAKKYYANWLKEILAKPAPRKTYIFEDAITKFLTDYSHKRSSSEDQRMGKELIEKFGNLPLERINIHPLQSFIKEKQMRGLKNTSINKFIGLTGRILKLAANDWYDEHGRAWVDKAMKLTLLPSEEKREPIALSWEQQDQLFSLLPDYLHNACLFKVNTGLRNQEVCTLEWNWEYEVPELGTSIFIIPKEFHKNKHDRIVVLNSVAKGIVEKMRGQHSSYVFVNPAGEKIYALNTTTWYNACEKMKMKIRIHDLKHTFGSRLRAANVPFPALQTLLGHTSNNISLHYSQAQIKGLLDAANSVCDRSLASPTILQIKRSRNETT